MKRIGGMELSIRATRVNKFDAMIILKSNGHWNIGH